MVTKYINMHPLQHLPVFWIYPLPSRSGSCEGWLRYPMVSPSKDVMILLVVMTGIRGGEPNWLEVQGFWQQIFGFYRAWFWDIPIVIFKEVHLCHSCCGRNVDECLETCYSLFFSESRTIHQYWMMEDKHTRSYALAPSKAGKSWNSRRNIPSKIWSVACDVWCS